MKAYIFQAALICEDCSHAVQGSLVKPAHVDMHDESSYDSDEWPKGPYGQGGGEADTPQHCDMCHVFLNNPLTPDGREYVKQAWRDKVDSGRGSFGVLRNWAAFYHSDWLDFEAEMDKRRERLTQLTHG